MSKYLKGGPESLTLHLRFPIGRSSKLETTKKTASSSSFGPTPSTHNSRPCWLLLAHCFVLHFPKFPQGGTYLQLGSVSHHSCTPLTWAQKLQAVAPARRASLPLRMDGNTKQQGWEVQSALHQPVTLPPLVASLT